MPVMTIRSNLCAVLVALFMSAGTSCSGLGTGHSDAFPPIVNWLSPTGDVVSGVIRIEVEVLDEVGIRFVRFYVDGVLIGEKNSVPHFVTYDTEQKPDGPLILGVVAEDLSGNRTGRERLVTIQNAPE
jgi:hypothetical protein